MPECVVCGENDFFEADGLYFCSTCQTQSQEIRVQTVGENDWQAENEDNCPVKVTAEKKTRKKKVVDKGRPWSSYEGFQYILLEQVKAVIKLGARPALKGLVFQIWANYLSKLGIAFSDLPKNLKVKQHESQRDAYPGTLEEPLTEAVRNRASRLRTCGISKRKADSIMEKTVLAHILDGEEFYEGDNPTVAGQTIDIQFYPSDDEDLNSRRKSGLRKSVNDNSLYKLRLLHLVCFVYLGLMFTNPGVTVVDMIRWIKKGQLAYLNAVDVLPSDLKFCLTDNIVFGGKKSPPKAHRVRMVTGKIAFFLGIHHFPEFPVAQCISKYILELDLPAEMHSLAINLMNHNNIVVQYSLVDRQVSTPVPFWEGFAMAYIIVTLKLLLGLDDSTERLMSSCAKELMELIKHSHKLFVWEDWVAHMNVKLACLDQSISGTGDMFKPINSDKTDPSLDVPPVRRYATPLNSEKAGVRENLYEVFSTLASRMRNRTDKQSEHETQSQSGSHDQPSMSCDHISESHDQTFDFLAGDTLFEDEVTDMPDSSNRCQDENVDGQVSFRQTSLKYLTEPLTFLEELDRRGLTDFTVTSSCMSASDDSDSESGDDLEYQSEIEEGSLNQSSQDLFKPPTQKKPKFLRSKDTSTSASLKKIMTSISGSVPTKSKITDRRHYEEVLGQLELARENFFLQLDVHGFTYTTTSMQWLVKLCSKLIDCDVPELQEQVRNIETAMFDEERPLTYAGRYNFKYSWKYRGSLKETV